MRTKVDTIGKPLLKSANKFNVKVVGLPEVNLGVSSQQTFASSLCFSLFRALGADVSIRDIDTANRVPKRLKLVVGYDPLFVNLFAALHEARSWLEEWKLVISTLLVLILMKL